MQPRRETPKASPPLPVQKERTWPSDAALAAISPLRWKHEHQVAWIVASALGAAVALLYGFSRSRYSAGESGGALFALWLERPELYWHWPMMGAVIAGLVFYLIRLLRA